MKQSKPYIEFIIGGVSYKSPYALSFSSEFSMQGATTTKAIFYNPPEDLITDILNLEKREIVIDAGFENDHGVLTSGDIYKLELKESYGEKILELKISDNSKEWANSRVSKSWPANVSAKTIVTELAELFSFDQGEIEITSEKKYSRGVTFNTTLKNAFESIARDTESDFFIRDKRLYFLSNKSAGLVTNQTIDRSTGLIGQPEMISTSAGERDELEKRKVKMLFSYKLGAGDNLTIKSMKTKHSKDGKLEKVPEELTAKILRGRHLYSKERAVTELEVQAI